MLVPFQCASVSGQKTDTLRAIVREIAALIVELYKKHKKNGLKREVTERIVKEYLDASSEAIWGGVKNDIILKTFYK